MSDRRRILAVRISDEAREAIQAHCLQYGITITAWVEALGTRLIEMRTEAPPDDPLQAVANETVRRAREIDAARRTRS